MKRLLLLPLLLLALSAQANYLFIPMGESQRDHLKAYGLTYWILEQQIAVDWLLNYEGGSFMVEYYGQLENEAILRGITYKIISDAQATQILSQLAKPDVNSDVMRLDKAPKIAVYSPASKQPWDDAVTLVLTYAEIPYDVVFDDEVMRDELPTYDWLHLHHEDFTGQYGKFYRQYRNQAWYIKQQQEFEATARKYGFAKVSQLKLAVVKKIKAYVASGGFLFAMCSATDTFDIALAAEGVDFLEYMYDGDPMERRPQERLNYGNTLAFEDFQLELNPFEYEYSNIDKQQVERYIRPDNDYFQLFKFSAKWDPVPTMLTQNHTHIIKGFMGQTTAYRRSLIKPDVLIMGENKDLNEARYIHGELGKGFWTFYGGHDPEDYQHFVGEEPTDLALHPNSPGYRLILNNILFPAARRQKRKT